ncbi:MAG: hypothetical protein K6V73_10175 [Firmicutes bacterium]|nr:hypothetical protein [Bacillota bacterium]
MFETDTDHSWRELYDAMAKLYTLAPWQWMSDTDLFAVRRPEDATIGYVSVFGAAGESFGVFVFLGAYGLWTYERQAEIGARRDLEQLEQIDSAELLERFPYGLSALFEDRTRLSERERTRLRALGLAYRGRNAWPQARFHEPGYLPTPDLTPAQLELLATAVEQTVEVASRVLDDPDYLVPPETRVGWLRLRTLSASTGRWVDGWHRPRAARREPTVRLDLEALLREVGPLRPPQGAWEVDFAYLPGAVSDGRDGRPYFPRLILVVDAATGLVLGHDVGAPERAAEALQLTATRAAVEHGPPEHLKVSHPDAARLLAPLARAVGARMTLVKRLPRAQRLRQSMVAAMEREL